MPDPWATRPLEAIRSGAFALPDGGRGILSPVYVDNLVDGIVLAASEPRAVGHVFTLTDGVGMEYRQFFAPYHEWLGKSVKYAIVGSAEANPAENRLSNESPVGKALIGHRRNEVVEVSVPRGPKRKLKITKIEAA